MFLTLRKSAEEVMTDTGINSRDRRAELRAISKAMMPLMPAVRLLEAERAVRGAQQTQDRPKKSATLTPAPSSGPSPLRMRPRP